MEGKEEHCPGSRNTPFLQQHCHINTMLRGAQPRWQINWEPGALWQRHRALVAVPAVLAVPCTGTSSDMSRAGNVQGDAQTHGIKVKSNSGQGQRVLSSKLSLTAALSELETLRNVSQVVMEKSLPHFLQTEEQSISANRLKQTILFSAEGWKYNRWVRNNFSSPFFFQPCSVYVPSKSGHHPALPPSSNSLQAENQQNNLKMSIKYQQRGNSYTPHVTRSSLILRIPLKIINPLRSHFKYVRNFHTVSSEEIPA